MARKLKDEHIKKMQAGRAATRAEREEAHRVVTENRQLLSAKFWAGVDFDLAAKIGGAIEKAQAVRKQARIKELEKELARLKGE